MNKMLKCSRYVKNFVKSLVSLYVSDVDFSSVYPNVMRGCNIARDTFRSAIYSLGPKGNRDDVIDISSRTINTKENTVGICSDYMNLPNYSEFDRMLENEFGEENEKN